MSMMERILRLMAERKASDVYLSAHSPAIIKINGQCIAMNSQVLPVEATINLLSEVVPPNRIEELKETGELNMAIPLADVGNFRLSAMRQRGTYAAVIRYISTDIPALSSLNLPNILADLVMEKRGLILHGGRHRIRQIHHAGLDAGPPQRKRDGPHPDHRRPGGIRVPQQEVRGQPARGRQRHRSRWRSA